MTLTAKQQARYERAILAWPETHGINGEQTRGPVWRGALPMTHDPSHTQYTPAHRKANEKLDEKLLGFGVVPESGLAHQLARLPRRHRRSLLAIVQRKAGVRRAREERALVRRLAADRLAI